LGHPATRDLAGCRVPGEASAAALRETAGEALWRMGSDGCTKTVAARRLPSNTPFSTPVLQGRGLIRARFDPVITTGNLERAWRGGRQATCQAHHPGDFA